MTAGWGGVPVACPMGREPRVNGSQLLGVGSRHGATGHARSLACDFRPCPHFLNRVLQSPSVSTPGDQVGTTHGER